MFTLTQLRYIVAIDQHRHFVSAAKSCFITQPTLSMQIKKLEEQLDVIIFDRGKHPIVPTDIGIVIIAQARKILSESSRLNESINEYKGVIKGNLNLGVIPSIAPYLIPLFLGAFSKKYPLVNLKVVEMVTDEIISELRKGMIDVGLIVGPLKEQDIIEKNLYFEQMNLLINTSHSLAKKGSIVQQDLSQKDLWLMSDGHCFRSQVINLCQLQEGMLKKGNVEYSSGSLETIKKLVEKEGGYTLLPELAIDTSQISKNTVIKTFDQITPLRQVNLAFTRNYVKASLLKALKQEIQACVPTSMLKKNEGMIVEWRK